MGTRREPGKTGGGSPMRRRVADARGLESGGDRLPGACPRGHREDRIRGEGDASLVAIAPGAVVPEHVHPHEQMGMVVSGTMTLTVAGETHRLSGNR